MCHTSLLAIFQQTSPSYSPVCPGENVVLTCNVTGNPLLWINPEDMDDTISFNIHHASNTFIIGYFTLVWVIGVSNIITSEARLYNTSILS